VARLADGAAAPAPATELRMDTLLFSALAERIKVWHRTLMGR
jgi:hypothetical protein